IFKAAVRRLPLEVRYPDGTVLGKGAASQPPAGPPYPVMTMNRPEAFAARLGDGGLIGLGESYMAGDWDADDLTAVMEVFAARVGTLVPEPLQKLRALYLPRQPRRERNTEQNTRSNISRHYDLSNDLFASFLDSTMTYSSALFPEAGEALNHVDWDGFADAQQAKIDRLLDKAGVKKGTRVLEIGTGWGELALRAAARGATVYSVTLSSEQQELARQRVAEAGYADAVTIELKDYRAVEGEYDAVVSVEMIEAVATNTGPRTSKRSSVSWRREAGWPSKPSPLRTTGCWPRAPATPGCTSTSSPEASFRPCGPSRRSPKSRRGSACGNASRWASTTRRPSGSGKSASWAAGRRSGASASTRYSSGCGSSTSATPGRVSPRATSTSSRWY
ncbi:cyclopropane-fatty-acyl-phospholipid synthase, partial [Arthrobacter sp. Hiyo6]